MQISEPWGWALAGPSHAPTWTQRSTGTGMWEIHTHPSLPSCQHKTTDRAEGYPFKAKHKLRERERASVPYCLLHYYLKLTTLRILTVQLLGRTVVVKNLRPQLPGAAGLGRGPLLPFILLHQGSHAPAWIPNLLIHAAVPKGRGHQQRRRCQSFRSTQQVLIDTTLGALWEKKMNKAKPLP